MKAFLIIIGLFLLLGCGTVRAQSAIFTIDHNLFQPNKNNVVTTVFQSPYNSNALLVLYNTGGEVIKVLYSGQVMANAAQTLTWDGTNGKGDPVDSGIYIFRLQLNLEAQVKRLLLLH